MTDKANLLSRSGIHKPFLDTIVNFISKADRENDLDSLHNSDIADIVSAVSLHRDTPLGRFVVTKLSGIALSRLQIKPKENFKGCISIGLSLAQLGLYDEEFFHIKLFLSNDTQQ